MKCREVDSHEKGGKKKGLYNPPHEVDCFFGEKMAILAVVVESSRMCVRRMKCAGGSVTAAREGREEREEKDKRKGWGWRGNGI